MKSNLFDLIKTLSKSEKRYFTVSVDNGKKGKRYLKLFHTINEMQYWDNDFLKKRFPQNLSADKRYLYEAILKNMRDYRSTKSRSAQMKERLLDAEYLYERGLFDQARDRLSEAKKIAFELKDSFFLLHINIVEQQFLVDTKRKISSLLFQQLLEEREMIRTHINAELRYLNTYVNLLEKVSTRYELNTETDKENLISEFPFLSINEVSSINSVRGRRRFLLCKALFYHLLGKSDMVYDNFNQIITWWDDNPILKSEEYFRYIADVSNLINTSYFHGNNIAGAQELNEKLQQEKDQLSYHEQRRIFNTLSISNLLYRLNKNDLSGAEKLIPELEAGIAKFGLRSSITLTGNIATVYFLNGKYEKCIKWCDFIIKNTKANDRIDIQNIIRIYKLFCLFELGNIDVLDSNLRKVQRFFRIHKTNEDRIEINLLLKYFQKITRTPVGESKKIFEKLKEHLTDIKNKNSGNSILGVDELILYIDNRS